ncbi:MAG TPA: hypothetical protein VJY33_12720, partial [Isosphaeraceae bacterium]|nr:hypothetical protein [Isosphaeraceae bacterium]
DVKQNAVFTVLAEGPKLHIFEGWEEVAAPGHVAILVGQYALRDLGGGTVRGVNGTIHQVAKLIRI